MAPPRFGYGARRPPPPPRPIGGFQPVGSAQQPGTLSGGFPLLPPGRGGFQLQGIQPPSVPDLRQTQLRRLRNDPNLPDWVKSELEERVIEGTKSRYDRPLSVLGGIARVLGVGENAAVGLLQSVHKEFKDVRKDPFSPWTWLNAATGLDNFVEVASAVKENRTYENWLQESQKPGSFLHENAFVIGLGLSIFGDPLTYVTFGSTSASKVAAQKLWYAAAASTHDEALTALERGIIARTGEDTSKYANDYTKVVHAIHVAAKRPYSMGDSMDYLRRADKGQLPDIDSKYIDEIPGLKSRPFVRRQMRKTFARGGRGIRFMGKELGYTRGLGGKTIRGVEKITPGLKEGDIRSKGLTAFAWAIPNEKLYRIEDDMVRTAALLELTRANHTLAYEKYNAFEEVAKLFVLDEVRAAKLKSAPWLARSTIALKNLLTNEQVPIAVPTKDRMGLLKEGFTPTGRFQYVLKDLKQTVLNSRDDLIETMKLEGFDDRNIKPLLDKWDKHVKAYDDPFEVLARWQATATAHLGAHRLVDQLVHNPILARPYLRGVHDIDNAMVKFEEEQVHINQRLAETIRRLGETGRSPKSIAALNRVRGDLITRSGVVKMDYDRLVATRKDLAKRGPGVTTEAEFRQIFREDGVPFKWKGQTFLVPAPVAHSLEQIRNPELLDIEMRKFLKVINYVQNKWKIAATSLNPSFWWMNALGGAWNNMLGGVYNPGDYGRQFADRVRRTLDEDSDTKLASRLAARVDQKKLETSKARARSFEEKGVGGGQVGFEIHPARQELRRKADVPTKKREAFRAARRTYAATAVGIELAPDDWVPDDIEDFSILGQPVFNPVAGVLLGLPEATRFGRMMTQEVETSLRETPMLVAQRDPSHYQLLEAVSIAPPVNFGRWMGQTDVGKTQFARETTWDIGAMMAMKYQFDYTNLTNIERDIAKTFFPFYVFNKNNFVLQAQELAQRPRFVANAFDVGNFANYITEDEQNQFFQELLPEYFDKLGMFRLPVPDAFRDVLGLPQGQDVYLNPKLPYASLNLFPPIWQLFMDGSITPSNQKFMSVFSGILGSVGPASALGIKPAIEYSTGYNLGLARPIDYQMLQSGGWRNSYREAPGWMKHVPGPLRDLFSVHKDPNTGTFMMPARLRYIADQMATPFMNSAGDVFNWGSTSLESDRVKANAFAWISGIRLTPVDPLRLERGWLYRMENYLESRKANLKATGEIFPREDEIFLRQLRAQIRVIEHAWDTKQEALQLGG